MGRYFPARTRSDVTSDETYLSDEAPFAVDDSRSPQRINLRAQSHFHNDFCFCCFLVVAPRSSPPIATPSPADKNENRRGQESNSRRGGTKTNTDAVNSEIWRWCFSYAADLDGERDATKRDDRVGRRPTDKHYLPLRDWPSGKMENRGRWRSWELWGASGGAGNYELTGNCQD
jgi:hypothetical protein